MIAKVCPESQGYVREQPANGSNFLGGKEMDHVGHRKDHKANPVPR